jgi:pimeloyl-ACP methyl ester carboxylesterase
MLAFDRAGTGEPLLVLHGIGTTRDDFSALVPRLAAEYDVLAVDLPAHGDSPAIDGVPTVAALTDVIEADLDAHGLHTVHVLGNSLGGRLGIELARRGRARSLVALSPSGLAGPPERVYLGLLMGSARVITRSIRPFIGTLARTRAGRAALLASFRARPWEASRAEALGIRGGFAGSDDFWRTLLWAILLDVPSGLDQIRCPVTLAQGSLDLIGAVQAPRYLPLIPGSRFQLLVGAGHAPQSDASDAIVRLVRQTVAAASAPIRSGSASAGVTPAPCVPPMAVAA